MAWVLAVCAFAMTGARWLDLAWTPVVLIQSLSPLAAPIGLVASVGVLLPGHWAGRASLAGVCVLVLAVHAAIWLPWLTDETPAPGRRLTIMTVNLFHGRADTQAISRHVRTHGVDVLALTEIGNGARHKLRAEGIFRQLPYVVPSTPTGGTTVIRSRLRLTAVAGPPGLTTAALRNQAATLRLGRALTLSAVHLFPPTPPQVRLWRSGQADLTEWAQSTPGPLIIAGDFNASFDHPGMRQLLAAGLRDAHEVAGQGRPPTWPNGRRLPPFVSLDHVLVRDLGVASVSDISLPGTDHDAILVKLVVPARR